MTKDEYLWGAVGIFSKDHYIACHRGAGTEDQLLLEMLQGSAPWVDKLDGKIVAIHHEPYIEQENYMSLDGPKLFYKAIWQEAKTWHETVPVQVGGQTMMSIELRRQEEKFIVVPEAWLKWEPKT